MPIISGGSGSGSGGGIGSTSLIYRYTVAGSVKASIDTGVDTPDAGSNIWTGGDTLEMWLYCRTDEATNVSQVDLTFNNDTTAGHYLYERFRASNATLTGVGTSAATTFIGLFCAGASADANVFSAVRLTIPNFAGTVGAKGYEVASSIGSSTAANNEQLIHAGAFTPTAAITRLKVIPDTAAKNFAVGSQLLIYKRSSS